MSQAQKRDPATLMALIYAIVSGLLGVVELSWGWWVSSLAMMADSINMLSDVFSGIVVAVAAHIHRLEPDENHPFGHYRAEPLGALIMGVIMMLLGLKILQTGISTWVGGELPQLNLIAVFVPLGIILFKGSFWLWVRTKRDSPSLTALAIDSRNDMLASFGTLLGLVLVQLGYGRADTVVALLMGAFILFSGGCVVRENIGMLMGERPPQGFFEQVDRILKAHPMVLTYAEVRAHQVGDQIHLAATLSLDGHKTLTEAHAVETELMAQLQEIEGLSETFLHLKPTDHQ